MAKDKKKDKKKDRKKEKMVDKKSAVKTLGSKDLKKKTPSKKETTKKEVSKKEKKESKEKVASKKDVKKTAAVKTTKSVGKPVEKAPKQPISVKSPVKPVLKPVVATKLPQAFLDLQKKKLQQLRDALLDQMQDVAQDSLRSAFEGGGGAAFGQHMGDAGSDAYEKDFALTLLSQEQDSLYEIEEAIKRIEGGTYGVCEMSGEAILKARLEAIPWARFTVKCQAEAEKSNRGRNKWDSTPHFMDVNDSADDDDDDDADDEGRNKSKD